MLRRLPRTTLVRFYSKDANQLSKHLDDALFTKSYNHAINLLQDQAKENGTIPQNEIVKFHDHCRSASDPVLNHMFVQLVPLAGKIWLQENINRAIQLYVSSGETESALAFLRDVQLTNYGSVQLSYDTLESLVLAAKWHKDVDICWQAVQMIQELHSKVYSRTWGLFLSAILENEHYEALVWFHKNAAIPGYIILDDHSHIRMAQIASKNGDFSMCRWSILRMRRRQRALNKEDLSSAESLDMFLALIESVAQPLNTDGVIGSIKSSCRYLIRLNDASALIRVAQLPRFVSALKDPDTAAYVHDIYDVMKKDIHANEAVKTTFFNLLLASMDTAESVPRAIALYTSAREASVEFNEESIIQLLRLAKLTWDPSFARSLLSLCASPISTRVFNVALMVARDIEDPDLEHELNSRFR